MKNKNRVKNIITLELTKKWPMSAKELYDIVVKQRDGITYHAVHKAATQLVEQGVLEREGGKYLINHKWVENVKNMLDVIKHSYLSAKPLFLPGLKNFTKESETKTFIFENLEKADNYKKRLQWEYLMNEGEKTPYCSIINHPRSPLFAGERALNIMSLAQKAKSHAFILIEGNTPIDEWCADYYRNEYVKVQTNFNPAESCETAVLGDIIVQIYIPEWFRKQMNSFYQETADVSDVNIAELYSIYRRNAEIRLVIIKNKYMAKQLTSKIMENFKRDKLAIFDVNGTLVEGFLVTDFAEYFTLRGVFNPKIMEEIKILDRAYKQGEISFTASSKKIIEKYSEGLAGQKVEDIKKAAEDFVHEGRLPLFHYSKKLFNRVNSYYKTLIITKGTPEIAEAFKSIFPYDYALTSVLGIKDGKYTGKVSRNLAGKGNKEKVLIKWLHDQKADINSSLGFGDSHHDVSFLERVRFPFAIKPTKKLKAISKERGWKIYFEDINDKSIFEDIKKCL